jgi:hypothetical protein
MPLRRANVGDAERLGEVALALQPLAPQRGQLALHQRRAPLVEHQPLAAVGGVRDLDGDARVLHLPPVGEAHHGRVLPLALALVERRERARRARLRLPLGEHPRRACLVGARRGVGERGEGELARVGPDRDCVAREDGLQLGRRLEAGVREVLLARDGLAHRLTFAPQPVERERGHRASR